MMTDYDVIVVGAGPAGSIAAREAAKKGAKTLLIERKKEIGAPVRCGEGIGVEHIKGMDIELTKNDYVSVINGARLISPDLKNNIIVRTEQSKGYVLDRKSFDKHLAMEAGRAGADIMVKTEVIDVIKDKDNKVKGVKVVSGIPEASSDHTNNDVYDITCNVLIAADGAESRVARMAGVGINTIRPLSEYDSGYEYEMVNVDCDDLIELYFSNEYAPRGYLWIFPKGKDSANVGVGIGGDKSDNGIFAKKYLDEWIKGPMHERFKHAQPVAIKGGLIPVGSSLDRLVADGFMVIGTAAHQVDPIHGGGIGLAMKSGLMAGAVAGDAINNNDYSESFLKRFENMWNEKLGPKLKKRLLLRKAVEQLNDNDFNSIFNTLDDNDINLLLEGKYKGVALKVLKNRPQLLKSLKALIV